MEQLFRWDGMLSEASNDEVVNKLTNTLLSRLANAAIRDHIQRCIAGNDYRGLIDCDPHVYDLSPSDTITVRQILALFQKRQDLDIGVDKRAEAHESFLKAEHLCKVTNESFRAWGFGTFAFPKHVDGVFHTAMRKISHILGDVPQLCNLRMRFGPGATTRIPKKNACSVTKLRSRFACSEDLAPYVSEVLEEVPTWCFRLSPEHLESVLVDVDIEDAKVSFVPKSAKTDRTICVEPILNSFVQLGIGDHLVHRLRLHGQDLSTQERNQKLARLGSLTGGLATLDLSSASDTISIELVRHLLPPDWFDFLSRYRSGWVVFPDGTRMKLHKFSSMGNGFTFPLETLIFLALARSVCEVLDLPIDDVSVYGDDIIIPVEAVPLFRVVLRSAGFLLNEKKSFWSGNFRESCGKDYLSGILVRPCYLKNRFTGQDLFRFHNFFVLDLDQELADIVLSYTHPTMRIWGPSGYGDGHLIGGPPPQPFKRHRGWGGYTFETYTMQSRSLRTVLHEGDFPVPLYQIYSFGKETLGFTPVTRDGKYQFAIPGSRGYKRTKIYTFLG